MAIIIPEKNQNQDFQQLLITNQGSLATPRGITVGTRGHFTSFLPVIELVASQSGREVLISYLFACAARSVFRGKNSLLCCPGR